MCFTLPAGWTMGKVENIKSGAKVELNDPAKKKSATIFWVKPEEYNSRVMQTELNFKVGDDQKTEKLLDGKGVYYENAEKNGERRWFTALVQGESHAWHCTGGQPKTETGTELAEVCKSMTPK